MHNKTVKDDIQDVCRNKFKFKMDKKQQHKLQYYEYTTQSALDHAVDCDKYFIKALKNGHMWTDKTRKPKVLIPFFVKHERHKNRVIFDYSFTRNGDRKSVV